MEAPKFVLALPDLVDRWMVEGGLAKWVRTVQAQPTGGCNACRFAEPLSDGSVPCRTSVWRISISACQAFLARALYRMRPHRPTALARPAGCEESSGLLYDAGPSR